MNTTEDAEPVQFLPSTVPLFALKPLTVAPSRAMVVITPPSGAAIVIVAVL